MKAESRRVMGLDVGHVRIGVAISDPGRSIAMPHEVLECVSTDQDCTRIAQMAQELGATHIVAGLPLNQRGEVGPQAEKVLAFLEELRERVDAEVLTIDERFTSAMAERMLIGADVKRKKRKKVVDKLAAQQILQTYLDRAARQSQR